MKKFMKGCAITALVLIIVGLAMAIIAGTVSGRRAIRNVVSTVTGGRMNINLDGEDDDWGISLGKEMAEDVFDPVGESLMEAGELIGESFGEIGEAIGEGISDSIDESVQYNIEDSMIFDDAFEIFKGGAEKYSLGKDIKDLEVEAAGCRFEVKSSEDENFYVEAIGIKKFQGYVEHGTLHVRGTMGTVTWKEESKYRIILYVPENYQFDHAELAFGAGVLYFDKLYANTMELSIGAGQLTAEEVIADTLDVNVGMGSMEIEEVQVNDLEAVVGMGELSMKVAIAEKAGVECAMGNLNLEVEGAQRDFDYTITCGMGRIKLGRDSYGGMAEDKYVDNGAGREMAVECAMGEVNISFTE